MLEWSSSRDPETIVKWGAQVAHVPSEILLKDPTP